MSKPVKPKYIPEQPQSRRPAYDRLNRWFEKNEIRWLLVMLACGFIAGVLSFDIKPSVDGDDTSYVLSAMRIVHFGQLPVGFRTPGYPIFLSLFVLIFGTNLVILKATSLLSFLGVLLSVYFVFRKRIPAIVVSFMMLLAALNPLMLKYSHQTFSEMLFTLVLLWTVHFILLAVEKESFRAVLLAAAMTMLSFYIRIAGATIAAPAVLFFAYRRQWKQLGGYVLICGLLYSPIKIMEWSSGSAAFGQASVLMLKNPYNTSEGMETFGGFADRFVNNIFNHANYQIPTALGVPMSAELGFANGQLVPSTSAFLGVLLSVILVIGCVVPIVTRPKSMQSFIGFFVLTYIAFISVALQNIYATPRMLLPIIPFLILGLFEGFRIIGNRWAKLKEKEAVSLHAKRLVVIAALGLTAASLIGTTESIDENYPILTANVKGNSFAGFTEDWANYLRASLWIKSQLPVQSAGIICRKPELFLLYAGNYNVYGTYKIDRTDPDTIIAYWKSLKMTHLLYDNFQWSSTLRRYVQPVAQKYPRLFEMIHQEGSEYPSYVFALHYEALPGAAEGRKDSR